METEASGAWKTWNWRHRRFFVRLIFFLSNIHDIWTRVQPGNSVTRTGCLIKFFTTHSESRRTLINFNFQPISLPNFASKRQRVTFFSIEISVSSAHSTSLRARPDGCFCNEIICEIHTNTTRTLSSYPQKKFVLFSLFKTIRHTRAKPRWVFAWGILVRRRLKRYFFRHFLIFTHFHNSAIFHNKSYFTLNTDE